MFLIQDTGLPETWLDQVFEWSIGASTQIAIIVFLSVGVASTVWKLALRPLLHTFSAQFRQYLEDRRLEEVRPLLRELGLLDERELFRGLGRLRQFHPRLPDDELKQRLTGFLSDNLSRGPVRLGKQHSEEAPAFIDLRAASMDPNTREQLADILANSVAGQLVRALGTPGQMPYTRAVGLKEGNPLVAALAAEKLKLPFCLYRGSDFPRFHGSSDPKDLFDGTIEPEDKVVILDDTTFRGTTLRGAAKGIQDLGATVCAVCLLFEPDRDIARRSLEEIGVEVYSVVKVDAEMLEELGK